MRPDGCTLEETAQLETATADSIESTILRRSILRPARDISRPLLSGLANRVVLNFTHERFQFDPPIPIIGGGDTAEGQAQRYALNNNVALSEVPFIASLIMSACEQHLKQGSGNRIMGKVRPGAGLDLRSCLPMVALCTAVVLLFRLIQLAMGRTNRKPPSRLRKHPKQRKKEKAS